MFGISFLIKELKLLLLKTISLKKFLPSNKVGKIKFEMQFIVGKVSGNK
jgi:hypothetical protein